MKSTYMYLASMFVGLVVLFDIIGNEMRYIGKNFVEVAKMHATDTGSLFGFSGNTWGILVIVAFVLLVIGIILSVAEDKKEREED